MRRRWPILAVTFGLVMGGTLPAAASAVGSGGPAVQPGGPVRHLVLPEPQGATSVVSSTNWSGYVATGSAFSSVASDWVQPAGQCSGASGGSGSSGGSGASVDGYAAFWVGLDGDNNNTVEQTGSEVDCAGGTAHYYAWYEMYPGAAVNFDETIKAGDRLAGSVTYEGSNQFQLTLADSTQGWSQTVTQSMAATTRSSAEIIGEAPCCAAGGAPLPLTDFGSVSFASATVNGSAVCDASPFEIVMPDVTVSPLSGCGAFTVTYSATSASGTSAY
jgi:Peptidase A4 family